MFRAQASRLTVLTSLIMILLFAALACTPAVSHHSSKPINWGTPTKRYEGCCRQPAPVSHSAHQPLRVQNDQDQLRKVLESSSVEIERLSDRSLEDKRRTFSAQKKAHDERQRAKEEAEAKKWEETRTEVMALGLEARRKRLDRMLAEDLDSAERRRIMKLVDIHNKEVRQKIAEAQRQLNEFPCQNESHDRRVCRGSQTRRNRDTTEKGKGSAIPGSSGGGIV